MAKLFKRFLAYMIDMCVIILITQSLSGIPMINKQLDAYNKYYDEYLELFESYGMFKTDLVNDFKDKELSGKEYQSLVEEHFNYQDILVKYYDDEKLTEKEYDKINKGIDKEYQKEYEKVYFKIEQNSIVYFIVYLVSILVYFVGFNKLTGGQTLGKKLTRLKIVSSKEGQDVRAWSYLVRTIILYQPIYYLVRLIGTSILNMDVYYAMTSIFSNIQYYLEIIIFITIMLRVDGRGIHDILARTRVILIDKNGDEIKDKLEVIVTEGKEKVKNKMKNKKVIDEEPSE